MTELPQRMRTIMICLCLAVATVAVYRPVAHFQFINYDDRDYVYENPHVRSGLTYRGLAWAFTTYHTGNWHPLTWLSHMLDCQLFGLNAGAHHLVNVFFHVLNTLLLFHVLNRMTRAPWRSGFVAALFALHPLHVESVAWIAERKDVLSAFFWMLTIWAYVRYVETLHAPRSPTPPTRPPQKPCFGGWKHRLRRLDTPRVFYATSLLFFALGLMSKPMVVTLPFVLLLLDYWPLGRTRWTQPATGEKAECSLSHLVREKLPFVALAAASCVITFAAQSSGEAIASWETLPLNNRIANAVVSYMCYLGKTFWPFALAVLYQYQAWPLKTVLSAGVAVVGLSGVVACRARRAPHLAVGWLWYMGTLVPVVGLVQVGSQSMADRYTYLPLIGIFIIVAWGMPRGMLEKRVPKLVATAAAAALLGFCAVKCRSQIGYWKNSETLLRHDIEVTGDNWLACNNLALALCEAGKQQEAMEYFAQALRLRPDYAESHFNLGLALAGLGRVPEAIEYWENAVRIKPDYAEAHYNLGLALEQTGKIGDAAQHWAQAIHVRPDFVEARNKLAWLLATVPPMEGGDPLEAVNLAEGTCKLTDNRVPMYLDTLAAAYAAAGRLNDAIVTAQKAIDLARSAGQTQLVSELEGRLQLYRAGQPYRQPVSR